MVQRFGSNNFGDCLIVMVQSFCYIVGSGLGKVGGGLVCWFRK